MVSEPPPYIVVHRHPHHPVVHGLSYAWPLIVHGNIKVALATPCVGLQISPHNENKGAL